MKKVKDDAITAIERALIGAHREQGEVNLGAGFTDNVMRGVRASKQISAREALLGVLENIIWQFVPVSATCAVLLFGYASIFGKSPTNVLAEAMFYGEMRASVVGI